MLSVPVLLQRALDRRHLPDAQRRHLLRLKKWGHWQRLQYLPKLLPAWLDHQLATAQRFWSMRVPMRTAKRRRRRDHSVWLWHSPQQALWHLLL